MQHSRLPVSATAAKTMIMMAASAAASLTALRFGFVGHLDVVTTVAVVAVGRSVGRPSVLLFSRHDGNYPPHKNTLRSGNVTITTVVLKLVLSTNSRIKAYGTSIPTLIESLFPTTFVTLNSGTQTRVEN